MKLDSVLRQDVMEELSWDASIKEAGIRVEVIRGIVYLGGRVDTLAEKIAAEKAAWRIAGVKSVVQKTEVVLQDSHRRGDGEIEKAARYKLNWDSSVPEASVLVKVENGWLTLGGAVDWNYQKIAAGEAVQNLCGIRGLTNLIEIKSGIQPGLSKEDIEKVLQRNVMTDAAKIHVYIQGNRVVLNGVVPSRDEQKKICHVAWLVPGVWQVENNLEVRP